MAELLDLCMGATGEPDEDKLDVLDWALAGDLQHGSCVKFREPEGGAKLWTHRYGSWWCVQYWVQGFGTRDVCDPRWIGNYAICEAGVLRWGGRRGHNKHVGNSVLLFRNATRGLRFLASHLIESYAPGVGQRIYTVTKTLAATRGALTKLGDHAVGPGAVWIERCRLKAEIENLEAELAELTGEGPCD